MTQKDKELLLKDLCARLPYGFIIHRYSDNCDIVIESSGIDEFAHFLEYSEGEEFTPYLRSMSSMTEEENKEFAKVMVESQDCSYQNNESATTMVNDWYLSKGFDVRGLIPKGLALEALEGMYEKKNNKLN